jgi:hypothetical protein
MVIGETIASCFSIPKGHDVGDIVDPLESPEAFARDHGPGRYDADEHSLDPFPGTKVSARAWGSVIHYQDGYVALDPIPWGGR